MYPEHDYFFPAKNDSEALSDYQLQPDSTYCFLLHYIKR